MLRLNSFCQKDTVKSVSRVSPVTPRVNLDPSTRIALERMRVILALFAPETFVAEWLVMLGGSMRSQRELDVELAMLQFQPG